MLKSAKIYIGYIDFVSFTVLDTFRLIIISLYKMLYYTIG